MDNQQASASGAPRPLPGRQFGPYRVEEMIGAGGMGEVYRARDTRLGRDVAVKLLPAVARDPAVARRLLFEARTVARLEHPNVVQVYDVGCQDGVFFMVMQLVGGRTLEDRLLEIAVGSGVVREHVHGHHVPSLRPAGCA